MDGYLEGIEAGGGGLRPAGGGPGLPGRPPCPAGGRRAGAPSPLPLLWQGEVWEGAAAALLCGEHLLLAGPKATGKTCWRRIWPPPSAAPPGTCPCTSTWTPPPPHRSGTPSRMDRLPSGRALSASAPGWGLRRTGRGKYGQNEALAVLHATLDFRRVIDVPGYQRIPLDPAARFIGTMNYGYAGTRELNEALVSPLRGAGYAGHLPGKTCKAPPPGLSGAENHLGGAVLRPVPGSAAEVRQRRDLHQGPGSAGAPVRPST